MKCIIPGPNIKGRAIHSLAKFGEDLYVEASGNELHFRTVNLSKTAYASYTFSSIFFSFFNFGATELEGSVTCQISMRSALNIFRSPLTLDRTTESVQIQFQPKSDKIIFIVKYKKGVVKTFNVPVIECEALQAYYQKDYLPNTITIQPKIVGEILTNFQNNQDEITWKVTKSGMLIKNYSEPEDDSKGIRTEICIDKDEFDKFKIESETEITFCLKELRAVLLFSDSVPLPLTANFNISSKPIVFIIKNDIFEVNIVVSTLSAPDSSYSENSFPAKSDSNRPLRTSRPDADPGASGDLPEEQNSVANGDLPEEQNSVANSDLPEEQNSVANGDLPEEQNSIANGDLPEEQNSVANGESNGRDKLRLVFQRCFNNEIFDVRNLPGYNVVLASDSDPED